MTTQHIMLDLETLGTQPGSIVLTIGAVKFSKLGVTEKFYRAISEENSAALGLTSDVSTRSWWATQSLEAQKAAFAGTESLGESLLAFTEFCGTEVIRMWGNGSDFDNVLLEEAYRAAGLEVPWKFTGNRCYRTIKNLFPKVQVPSVGTAHNALDDAIYQANHLIAISKRHCLNLS